MLRLQQHSPSPESKTWGANYQNYYLKSWVGDGGFRQSSLPNRLTTLLIPQLNSHRSPLTEARLLLWSRSRAGCSPSADRQMWRREKGTELSIPTSFFQTHKSQGCLLPKRSGSIYSVMRKARKISLHGTMRCGTECSLLLQKRGSCWCTTAIAMNLIIPPNITPYIPIYLAITEAMESQTIPQLNSQLHATLWSCMDQPSTPHILKPLTFRAIICHQQNAFYHNSF